MCKRVKEESKNVFSWLARNVEVREIRKSGSAMRMSGFNAGFGECVWNGTERARGPLGVTSLDRIFPFQAGSRWAILVGRFWMSWLGWSVMLKIKQVLLDSCSSKRMQAEDKHKPLYQSSQPSTDPKASKQYSDSFPLISFKSQHVMSPMLPLLCWNQKREFFS